MKIGKDTIHEAAIEDIQEAFRLKEITAERVTELFLERIKAFNKKGPAVQAVITTNTKALKQARELDMYYKENGTFKGPLHGIPFLVKDQAETKDIVTTFGSSAFRDYVPQKDAVVIQKLKTAGAIILAKANLCDFAAGWFSFSSMQGHTKNPYDGTKDAGGSSAGTAAGIASGMAPAGIGEDTGGSLRLPASFNHLYTIRVTTGLISRTGFSPLVHFQDTPGPMAATVKDVAKTLDVIAGFDPEDKYTVTASLSSDIGNYEESLADASLKGKRFGVFRDVFGKSAQAAPVNQLIDKKIELLKNNGAAIIEDVHIPDLKSFLDSTSLYAAQSKKDITAFLQSRPDAPLQSFKEVYDNQAFHPLNDLFHIIADGPDDPSASADYYEQRQAQEAFRQEILHVMAVHELDALLFPDVQIPPPSYEELENETWSCLTFPTNTVIASQSSLPAVSVPAGFTDEGLPVGMELLGRPLQEKQLLQLAYAYEQASPKRQHPLLESYEKQTE
ncbi:amidase [Sinobaca sp. H24]|uniref:amidase n=1 Tax=Sinobaca sp. H24 TaxID=2923376 RepID=UPI00207A43FA|nr:amidase [Sinobaca sp. H24]